MNMSMELVFIQMVSLSENLFSQFAIGYSHNWKAKCCWCFHTGDEQEEASVKKPMLRRKGSQSLMVVWLVKEGDEQEEGKREKTDADKKGFAKPDGRVAGKRSYCDIETEDGEQEVIWFDVNEEFGLIERPNNGDILIRSICGNPVGASYVYNLESGVLHKTNLAGAGEYPDDGISL
nr:hypothetical protein [Tanacetum cinerariifolium]